MTRPPKNWPAHVHYLTVPCFHSSLSGDALSSLKGGRSKGISLPSAPPSLGEVRPIVDPLHPAHGQHGLFATKKIPPQTLIVEYIGEVHSDERPTSDYDISLLPLSRRGDLRMSIWSLTVGIRKGDEIVVSYGKSWWAARSLS
ncbi:hypothetical protein F5888DRAFT_1791075 [Russula emetica]|nr:hypothetical protein F5888DRAFT_1791075 [Russula emetica]